MNNLIQKIERLSIEQLAHKIGQSRQNVQNKVKLRIRKGLLIENKDFWYETRRVLKVRSDLEL